MAHIIVPKRSRLSHSEIQIRQRGMEHLIYASKDINDWDFKQYGRPSGAPKETHHIFEGRCKKTGIVQPWPIDITQAKDGSFEQEHRRIIGCFAESLIWLDECIKENRERAALGGKGLVLPSKNLHLGIRAQEALQRGDHPNRFK